MLNDHDHTTSDKLMLLCRGEVLQAERDDIELHLAACPKCRAKLAEMFLEAKDTGEFFDSPQALEAKAKAFAKESTQVNEPLPKRPPNHPSGRFFQVAFVSMLVGFVGVTSVYLLRSPSSPAADMFRRDSRISNAPKLLSPRNGADIRGESVDFRWEPVANAKSYTITITDARGDILVQQATSLNAFSISAVQAGINNGGSYFWFVKARRDDGTTIDFDTAKFRIVK